MRLKPIAACIAIATAFLFFTSCKTDEEKKKLHFVDALQNLVAGTDSLYGNPTGQIVSAKAAQECFKAYDSIIKLHGFVDTPSATPLTILATRKITRREAFRGTELLDFLGKAAFRHEQNQGDGGQHLSVQVTLGIYTDNYLNYVKTLSPNNVYDSSKLGRIGVFLVTCEWDPTKHDWVPRALGDGPDDPSAFDFGGLKP